MRPSKLPFLTGAVAAGMVFLLAGAVAQTAPGDRSLTVPPPATPIPSNRLETIEARPHQPLAVPEPDTVLSERMQRQLRAGHALTDADRQLLRGAYLARAGDCIACHTARGGAPFAGGLPIASPIGTLYSTNITPDKTHGIGSWTYEDFARLMRTGVTRAGYTTYPAMPYPSYSRLSDEDLHDLYAYFSQAVPAVAQANRHNDIAWPLSMRWPLGIWRRIFAPAPTPYSGPAGADRQMVRGAYLVEGLGHCGSCHTPRAMTLQEKAMSDDAGKLFLSGGQVIDGWSVPSLRNEHGGGLAGWSQYDLVEFLRTGRNRHAASFGAMNDVIDHSTQYMSEADLNAVARYLLALSPRNAVAPYRYDDASALAAYEGRPQGTGAALYLDRCAGCHRGNGTGYGKSFPALAGNPMLQGHDATSAIHIVLSGGAQPSTRGATAGLTMAPYAHLFSDQQVADVVTYIQTAWGNQGNAVTPVEVARIRKGARPVQARER